MSEDERERESAPPGDVVVEAEDEGDEVENDWSPFDEIQEDFKPRPVIKVSAVDGLPTNFAPVGESDIPALSTETLVCMGDYSEFVLRDEWGQVTSRWLPQDVERMPNGMWRAQAENAQPADRRHALPRDLEGWVEVDPVRPPCKHYARQLTQFDLNAEAKAMLRVCAARRTTEGAFMSLRDRAMWACELREPQTAESLATLDEFDRRKMAEGKSRELFPIFSAPVADGNGIFGGSNDGE